MAYLKIHTLEFGDKCPPRTPVNRSRTRLVRLQPGYDMQESVWDFGDAGGFLHVFQSQNNTGYLGPEDVVMLQTLEANKATFEVVTDLLKANGQNETFKAYFDPESKPQYSPVNPSGSKWFFQLALYLMKQETP